MPETRLNSFPALSVDPRVGISRSASETGDRFYFSSIMRGVYDSSCLYFVSSFVFFFKFEFKIDLVCLLMLCLRLGH